MSSGQQEARGQGVASSSGSSAHRSPRRRTTSARDEDAVEHQGLLLETEDDSEEHFTGPISPTSVVTRHLGNGWMRVSGVLIGHGIRVVTDIQGKEHQGRPFSWSADKHSLRARAELPALGCLPAGPIRTVAFWMSIGYIIGSLLFVFGAAASLSSRVVSGEASLFNLVDMPYFMGAMIFQIANYLAMVEPLNEDLGFRMYLWERSALGGQAPKDHPPPVAPPQTRWAGLSSRLPFLGGLFYFLGGLCYCVMTAVPLLSDDPGALAEYLAVDSMAVVGGLGFAVGAGCYCLEYSQHLAKTDPNARAAAGPILWLLAGVLPVGGLHELANVGFLINSANMLGSLGFLLSGVFYFARPGSVARVLIQAETFLGYFLGSVLFLAGSVLLLLEVYAPVTRSHRRFDELRRLPTRGSASSASALLQAAGAHLEDGDLQLAESCQDRVKLAPMNISPASHE